MDMDMGMGMDWVAHRGASHLSKPAGTPSGYTRSSSLPRAKTSMQWIGMWTPPPSRVGCCVAAGGEGTKNEHAVLEKREKRKLIQ